MQPSPVRQEPFQHASILFEEYRALYGLAEFRLGSLEQRAAGSWALLAAFLSGFAALGPDAQAAMLLGTPLALIWLVRTTVNHARSFEDALRRLEEIERAVNHLAGQDTLVFQSRHPSRGKAIGGRTGRETVYTVVSAAILTLAACGFLFLRELDGQGPFLIPYGGYLTLVAAYLLFLCISLRAYRYQRESDAQA